MRGKIGILQLELRSNFTSDPEFSSLMGTLDL